MRFLLLGQVVASMLWCGKSNKAKKVEKVYCAPGNAGISRMADCIDISVTDVDALLGFAKKEAIDLTVVGPDHLLWQGSSMSLKPMDYGFLDRTREQLSLRAAKSTAKNF